MPQLVQRWASLHDAEVQPVGLLYSKQIFSDFWDPPAVLEFDLTSLPNLSCEKFHMGGPQGDIRPAGGYSGTSLPK